MPACSASRNGSERRVPKADDQNLRPFRLHLLEQIVTFLAAQIEQEQGRTVLLEDGLEPLGLVDVADLGETAKKSARSPNEIGVLRVENARGGEDHAAATSSWKRTRGSRM